MDKVDRYRGPGQSSYSFITRPAVRKTDRRVPQIRVWASPDEVKLVNEQNERISEPTKDLGDSDQRG